MDDAPAPHAPARTVSLMVLVGALGSVGSGIALLALPFLLVERGFALRDVGALYALVAGAEVLVHLSLARAPLLVARPTLALALLVASSLAWPGLLMATSPLAFVAVLAVASLSGAAAGPALQVLLARARGAGGAARSFATHGLLVGLGNALGLVLGGFLLPYGTVAALYGAAVVSLAGAALTAWVLLSSGARAPPPALRAAATETARLLRRSSLLERRLGGRRVAWPTAGAALHSLLFGLSLAAYPFFLPQHLAARGVPLAWLGAAIATSWVAFALAQPLGAWLAGRYGRPGPLVLASLLVAAALNALLLAPSLAGIVLAWVGLGVADGVGRPLVRALLTEATQDDLQASFAWFTAADAASRVAGPFLVAAAALQGGIPGVFLFASLALLASAAPLAFVLRRATPLPQGGATPA